MTSMPICEVDQYIGEKVHPLDPSFAQLGTLKVSDPAAYRRHISSMTFQAGESHTFSFWGPSRCFSLAEWRINGVPFPIRNLSLDIVNGRPPMIMTAYVLNP